MKLSIPAVTDDLLKRYEREHVVEEVTLATDLQGIKLGGVPEDLRSGALAEMAAFSFVAGHSGDPQRLGYTLRPNFCRDQSRRIAPLRARP